jgi:hypothetical protein
MPIRNETNEIRICDLCGKEEGKHLSSKDFFTEAPTVVVKNHEGTPLSFQLNIDVYEPELEDEIENTLDDVITSHDMMQMPQQQNPNIRMIPLGMIQIQEGEEYIDPYVICKGCYGTLVDMISSYGKFDKIEEF